MPKDYTLVDLQNFFNAHNVESVRMTCRKGKWEVNWQVKGGQRRQVEDDDLGHALYKMREDITDAEEDDGLPLPGDTKEG